LERSLLRRGYDAITSVDRASLRALREEGFSDAILVPNGVAISEFGGSREQNGTLRFLFVGRHVHQKGIDILLDAAGRGRSRIGQPFVVEIAGDGPERSRLERRANDLGLSDVVRFLGPLSRPDLVRAYARATVFVLPSRLEGFPLTILEAWASGVPVIATSVGGVPDLCDEGNSVLVPPSDPLALADAMTSLAGDPVRRERLGAAGRSMVRERYTWDTVAEAYERLYARCLERARGAGGKR
jgi:glycosyltransferase involved in cell wall biosynthesis